MRIIAIDFEASCLPRHGRSYPIEVGISGDGVTSRSWLIRPHIAWREWCWTQEAQALHGLTPMQLWRDGLPAAQVAGELADAIANARVVADSAIDQLWLDTLFAAARRRQSITVDHVGALIDERALSSADVFAAQERVDARDIGRHRAGEDARWLAALLVELGIAAAPVETPLFRWADRAIGMAAEAA